MTARNIIAQDFPPLKLTQTGRDAFHILSDAHLRHLPVVDKGRLLGILSDEDIFNHSLYAPLSTYDFSLHTPIAVRAEDHLFEVVKLMGRHRLTMMPVLGEKDRYLGLITENDLLRCLADTAAFSEMGAVIVLQMPKRDYALTQLARIVEEENAKVLSAFVTSLPDPEHMELTLKINHNDASRIIASFGRFGYQVMGTYSSVEHDDPLRERYESLMRYLNV